MKSLFRKKIHQKFFLFIAKLILFVPKSCWKGEWKFLNGSYAVLRGPRNTRVKTSKVKPWNVHRARAHGLSFNKFLLSFKYHEYLGGHPCFHEKRILNFHNFFDQSDYFRETCVDQHIEHCYGSVAQIQLWYTVIVIWLR